HRRSALRLVRPIQRINRLRQRASDADVEALDDAGLGCVVWWKQQPLESETTGGDGDRKDAANAVDPTVERELADNDRVVDGAASQWPGGREQAERDRQIERRSCLAHI